MTAPTREQKSKALRDEIHRLGGWVVSVPGADVMRFQFLNDPRCEPALQRLRDHGFEPMLRNAGLRFTPQGALPCYTYDVTIPADRQVIVDDRAIPKDSGAAKLPEHLRREYEAMRKACGLDK